MGYLLALLIAGAMGLHQWHRAHLVPEATRRQIVAEAARRMAAFNARRGTNVPAPRVEFTDSSTDEYASSNSDTWTINLNPDFVLRDLTDCLTDTIPHEEAHLIIDKTYPLRMVPVVNTSGGMPRVIYEMQSSVADHGPEWRAVMRDLGGDPCKHGYC